MTNSCQLGRWGESCAVQYLQAKGYKIIEQNYRLRLGEIDIIARDGEELVFVEVKSRSACAFGSPEEAVTLRKQRQISKVALAYLSSNELMDVDARFDVVTVVVEKNSSPCITLHRNAFDLCYNY